VYVAYALVFEEWALEEEEEVYVELDVVVGEYVDEGDVGEYVDEEDVDEGYVGEYADEGDVEEYVDDGDDEGDFDG